MRCPHCGKSVTPRTPMTPSQREVYAAMLRVAEEHRRYTVTMVAYEAGRAESTTWQHIEALAARGWLERGDHGRVPLADWTFTRPLDPDAVYLAHREAA